ncbi:transcriptional adapter 1-like isoform X2 [Mya arenaria]|uniref:transcriptional adapter 1-like isoform X2 n=1 Tax=Mya arenaria TaxID=6604 RepID=UPI0022DFA76D|nr:transcriptional adapter 1-like isoform X2 [Mya arenaria]
MAAPIDLITAKKNLAEVLGEEWKSYLFHLKQWFRMKIAKEEFDKEARKLLQAKTVHLHNEFLLAIFSKCHTLSASTIPKSPPPVSSSGKLLKKGKLKRKPTAIRSSFQRFVPVNPMSCAVPATYKDVKDMEFAGREMCLPDVSMLQGRLLVCAWEVGLTNIDEAVASLVMQALEIQLKNIISEMISRRAGYRMREKRFRYSFGEPAPNPYTRYSQLLQDRTTNSEATTISSQGHHQPARRFPEDVTEGYRAQVLACGGQGPEPRAPATLFNLLETLQTCKNVISSHSVYAPAMERIIHKLWHPSHEELGHFESQEVSVTQKTAVKAPDR